MSFFEDDIADFLDEAEFAVPLLIDGTPRSGCWLEPYEAASIFNLEVDNAAPVVLIAAAAGVTDDSVIYRGGVRYYVQSIQPDGAGMVAVVLSRHS